MKKIAQHVNAYCTFCKTEGVDKVKASWRMSYDFSQRACEYHKQDLKTVEDRYNLLDREYSEADYHTWMKL